MKLLILLGLGMLVYSAYTEVSFKQGMIVESDINFLQADDNALFLTLYYTTNTIHDVTDWYVTGNEWEHDLNDWEDEERLVLNFEVDHYTYAEPESDETRCFACLNID
jgi:hypothetical protein